jgi:hypothetical protein
MALKMVTKYDFESGCQQSHQRAYPHPSPMEK